MLGVLFNVALILAGGGLGLLIGGRVSERLRNTVMQGLGLCVVLIGVMGAVKTGDMLCVIVCIVLGGLLGEGLDIEQRLTGIGEWAQRRLARRGRMGGTFVQGFVTASLLYCVGAMAVVGSLESGLSGNHATLIAKAALDGVSAIFLAATLGPGVLLSAAVVLLYQGAIALGAGFVAPLLTDPIVLEMSAVGGLLILAIGLNMLEAAKVRVGNLLPAIFFPLLYVPLSAWIESIL